MTKKIVKRTGAAKKEKKGARYACGVCGLAVRVDEECGCVDVCDIVCCGEAMQPKKRQKPRHEKVKK